MRTKKSNPPEMAASDTRRPAPLTTQQLAHLRRALEQLRQLLDADAAARAALNN